MSLRRTLFALGIAARVALAAIVAVAPVHAAAAPPGSKNFTPPASAPNYFSNESGSFQGNATARAAQPGAAQPSASQSGAVQRAVGPAFAAPAPRSRVAAASRRTGRHHAVRTAKARGHLRVARGKAAVHRKFVRSRAAQTRVAQARAVSRSAKRAGPRVAQAQRVPARKKTVAAKSRPAPAKAKSAPQGRG